MNHAHTSTFIPGPLQVHPETKVEERGKSIKLKTGDYVEVEGSVVDWKKELEDYPFLVVTSTEPNPDKPVEVRTVKPKPVRQRKPKTARKSQDEIDEQLAGS
jgi:hypothetical protein